MQTSTTGMLQDAVLRVRFESSRPDFTQTQEVKRSGAIGLPVNGRARSGIPPGGGQLHVCVINHH